MKTLITFLLCLIIPIIGFTQALKSKYVETSEGITLAPKDSVWFTQGATLYSKPFIDSTGNKLHIWSKKARRDGAEYQQLYIVRQKDGKWGKLMLNAGFLFIPFGFRRSIQLNRSLITFIIGLMLVCGIHYASYAQVKTLPVENIRVFQTNTMDEEFVVFDYDSGTTHVHSRIPLNPGIQYFGPCNLFQSVQPTSPSGALPTWRLIYGETELRVDGNVVPSFYFLLCDNLITDEMYVIARVPEYGLQWEWGNFKQLETALEEIGSIRWQRSLDNEKLWRLGIPSK